MAQQLSVLMVIVVALLAVPQTAHASSENPDNPALKLAYTAIACACFEGSELRIDATKSTAPASCPCPYAAVVRKDIAAAIAQVPKLKRGDTVRLALALEQHFLTRSPDYERMLRYDPERYAWFLQNVRCTCEGCKATVYFSNCQLTCGPAVIYKRRARVWLAMGFSTDALLAYYLKEHNATHAARDQIDRAWLLPKRERRRGWMVPALLILGAIVGLGLLMLRVVRRSSDGQLDHSDNAGAGAEAAGDDEKTKKTKTGESSQDETGESPPSAADRDRVLDALDDLEQDGGW